MRMNTTFRSAPRESVSASDCLLVFLYFLIGASAALLGLLHLPEIHSPRLFLCALFGAVVLLSTSSFGWLFLPLCVFAFGLYAEQAAMLWLQSLSGESFPGFRQVLCSVFILPAFFLTGTHGLCVSTALQNALGSAGPSARSQYQKEFSRVLLSALLGLAAVFYFHSQ